MTLKSKRIYPGHYEVTCDFFKAEVSESGGYWEIWFEGKDKYVDNLFAYMTYETKREAIADLEAIIDICLTEDIKEIYEITYS